MRTTVIATKGERQWQGIPAIERAANGRLWCAFFSGGPKEPDPDNEILLTTSADNGVSWTAPEVIIAPPGATRAYDPCLWHDPSGRLWLFYNLANLETRAFGVWAITTEDASGATPVWSAPRQIPLDAPFCFRLNKPTVLADGAWLLPVTWARTAQRDPADPWQHWFAREEQLQGVARSENGGESWSFHGAVEAPTWALENMLVERSDGTVWMLIRTGGGVLWQSTSTDGGRTWSTGSPTDIVNPGARFFIRRLASGRLLLINTPDPSYRKTLRAYLSTPEDDEVFVGGLMLDPRDKVSYPDAVQAPDGTLYAVHDYDRYGAGEIVLNVFDEEEIDAADGPA